MLTAHVLGTLKAYAALVLSVLTAVATVLPADDVPTWLTVLTAVVGAIVSYAATYAVPNYDTIEDESDPEDPVIVELDDRDGPVVDSH